MGKGPLSSIRAKLRHPQPPPGSKMEGVSSSTTVKSDAIATTVHDGDDGADETAGPSSALAGPPPAAPPSALAPESATTKEAISTTQAARQKGSWHDYKGDDGERRKMMANIIDLLKQRSRTSGLTAPRGWDARIMPRLVKAFEVSLYQSATTMKDYKDMATLRQRLRQLVEYLPTTKKASSLSSSRNKAAVNATREEVQTTTELKKWRQHHLQQHHQLKNKLQYQEVQPEEPHHQRPSGRQGCRVDEYPTEEQPTGATYPTDDATHRGDPEGKESRKNALTTRTGTTTCHVKQSHAKPSGGPTHNAASSGSLKLLHFPSPSPSSTRRDPATMPSRQNQCETIDNSERTQLGASIEDDSPTPSPLDYIKAPAGLASSAHPASAQTPGAAGRAMQTRTSPSLSGTQSHSGIVSQQRYRQSHWAEVSLPVPPKEYSPVHNPQEQNFRRPEGSHECGRRLVHLQQQRMLLLLYHASICPQREHNNGEDSSGASYYCPSTPCCAAMKRLWRHVKTCKQRHCSTPYCTSARFVLDHFRQCRQDIHCTICGPVRDRLHLNVKQRQQDEPQLLVVPQRVMQPPSSIVGTSPHVVGHSCAKQRKELKPLYSVTPSFPLPLGTKPSVEMNGTPKKRRHILNPMASVAANVPAVEERDLDDPKKQRRTSSVETLHSHLSSSMTADLSPREKEALLLNRCMQLEEERDRAIQQMEEAERFALELSKKYRARPAKRHTADYT